MADLPHRRTFQGMQVLREVTALMAVVVDVRGDLFNSGWVLRVRQGPDLAEHSGGR